MCGEGGGKGKECLEVFFCLSVLGFEGKRKRKRKQGELLSELAVRFRHSSGIRSTQLLRHCAVRGAWCSQRKGRAGQRAIKAEPKLRSPAQKAKAASKKDPQCLLSFFAVSQTLSPIPIAAASKTPGCLFAQRAPMPLEHTRATPRPQALEWADSELGVTSEERPDGEQKSTTD